MSLAVDDRRPLHRGELTEVFKTSASTRQLIGLEHEKITYRLKDGGPVPVHGPGSIEALLEAFCQAHGWKPVYAFGALLAAENGQTQITLEPGGQVELSGSPLPSVAAVRDELQKHMADLISVACDIGIGFSSLGFHPARHPDDITFIEKPRYRIMREYFKTTGTRGLHMMACTATVQVNHDFASEAEAMEKLRAAQLASPYIAAMFCNSPFEDGKLTDWQSRRYFTWLDVDPQRCGLLPFLYRPDASFDDYAKWALAARVYGMVRDGKFIPNLKQTFAEYIEKGFEGQHATHGDWIDHLGTLYPEVRLKRTIEVRGADSGSLPHAMAVVALWRGLLDDPRSRKGIIELLKRPKDPLALQQNVAHSALCAQDDEGPILPKCRALVELARQGLLRLGEKAVDTLEPAAQAVESGLCPADEWRQSTTSPLNSLQVLKKSVYLPCGAQRLADRYR